MLVLEDVQAVLNRLGSGCDGAELADSSYCDKHKDSLSLSLTNQGGFDGVDVCIACVAELHKLLAQGIDVRLRKAD